MICGKRSIGIVCHFPPPPGGMPMQAEAMAAGLESEGFSVVRIPTNVGGTGTRQRLESLRGVRTLLRIPVFLFRLLRALPSLSTVHALACSGLYFFIFILPAALLAPLFGCRFVLHYHSGNAASFFRKCRWVVRFVARRAEAVVVPSIYLRRVFADLGIPAVVVPNVCNAARFRPRESAPVLPRFIVARHLEPVYNVGCIIRAFRLVLDAWPNAQLQILGGGSEEVALKQLASELDLEDTVEFLGYVDNDALPELYQWTSIFVNASLSDNQPVSILEAFAAGLPVITSPAGGIPCLVEDGETGLFFDPRDPGELAQKMIRLIAQPDLARTLARNGLEKIGEFSWPATYGALRAAGAITEAETDLAAARLPAPAAKAKAPLSYQAPRRDRALKVRT